MTCHGGHLRVHRGELRGGEEGVLGGAREGGRSEEGVEGEEECEVRGVR